MFSSKSTEDVKLEWMYKGANSLVDREEYLVGRKVDKALEEINKEEKQQQLGTRQPKNHVEHECIPPSIRDYKEQIGEQVDIAAKLQEDPLVAIRKREEESRRQFLNNPVQLKKLQKALKTQSKKKKKKKSHDSDDSDRELDAELLKKLQLLKDDKLPVSKKGKKSNALDTILMYKFNQLKDLLSEEDLQNILDGKSEPDSSSEDEKPSKRKKRRNEESESGSESSEDDKPRKKVKQDRSRSKQGYDKKEKTKPKSNRRHYSSDSSDRSNERAKDDKKSYKKHLSSRQSSRDYKKSDYRENETKRSEGQNNPKPSRSTGFISSEDSDDSSKRSKSKQNWGLVKADGTKIPLKRSSTISQPVSIKPKPIDKPSETSKSKRTRLTEEEKEKMRREMMANAAWRDKERAETVKQHREKESRESKQSKEYNPDFVQRELLKSANISSVESRIRSNINNIQRSKGDMSVNFSRRH